MTTTLPVTAQDTLASLLAKLRMAPAGRVLFIVPAELALDAVALRALRREASLARLDLALVTSDPGLRARAGREGISTFRDVAYAEAARWRRLRRERRLPIRPTTPAETVAPLPAGLYSKQSPSGFRPAAFLRAFVRQPSSWWAVLGLTLSLAVLFGGLLYGLATFIPAATITLAPAAERIEVTVPLRAVQDAGVDLAAGIVPAQALSVQVTGDARTETTGRRNEPAGKAKGRVVFINRTTREVNIPIGTTVATGTGNNARFVTTAELSLVPGGRAPAPVEALLPGPSGNVRAGTVTRVEGALGLSLLVANEAGFSGGTTSQVGIVTEEDKVRLEGQLFAALKQQALERLNERARGQRYIPAESVSYLELSPTFTPFVGEVSPELYLSMSVQAVGLAVDMASGNAAALAKLQTAMPPGTRLISDTVQYTPSAVVLEDARTLAFSVTAQGTLLRGVDAAAVRSSVAGLTIDEAEQALTARFALARSPEIRLGPDWLPYIVPVKLPTLPWRIRVIVDWDAGAQLAAR